MCYHLRDMEKFNLNDFFLILGEKGWNREWVSNISPKPLKYFNFGTIDVIQNVPICAGK